MDQDSDASPDSPILIGGVEKREIVVVDHDPGWGAAYARHEAILRSALGSRLLSVDHVGSTSVPGLAAKPIIDIVLTVEDSAREEDYLPDLEAAGYVLRVREPRWHEHRMVRTPERDVHIHIFSLGCSEVARNRVFRDRLRSHPEDRQWYETTKRRLAAQPWEDMNAYAEAKSEVIRQILAKAGWK